MFRGSWGISGGSYAGGASLESALSGVFRFGDARDGAVEFFAFAAEVVGVFMVVDVAGDFRAMDQGFGVGGVGQFWCGRGGWRRSVAGEEVHEFGDSDVDPFVFLLEGAGVGAVEDGFSVGVIDAHGCGGEFQVIAVGGEFGGVDEGVGVEYEAGGFAGLDAAGDLVVEFPFGEGYDPGAGFEGSFEVGAGDGIIGVVLDGDGHFRYAVGPEVDFGVLYFETGEHEFRFAIVGHEGIEFE